MNHITEQEYLDAVEEARHILIATAEDYCRVRDDAEDAVQEAILYCLKKLDQYDPLKASLITWVTNIVIGRARHINYYRERELEPEKTGFVDADNGEYRRAQSKNAEDNYEAGRNRVRLKDVDDEPSYDPNYDRVISVKQALAKLPEAERKAAIAILIEGYTESEYADAQGVSRPTVARLMAKAKASLRELLKGWDT